MPGTNKKPTPLELAREAHAANKGNGAKSLNPLEKAKAFPKSFRHACNAMCYQCVYDPLDKGSWRKQVKACTSPECALYTIRPQPVSTKAKTEED